jgi:hypothetical protein
MTELEAVNTMLAVIGEAPIDSFANDEFNEITDASLARQTLKEVSRDVQSEGWYWNKTYNVLLAKTSEDFRLFPDSTLRSEFSAHTDPERRYVQRGNRLYDALMGTYKIEREIKVDQIISELSWDELPHQAQQYIVIRAARINSNRFTNSTEILGYTATDEAYARAMLIRDEESRSHNNMLWGNQMGMSQGIGYLPPEGLMRRRQ